MSRQNQAQGSYGGGSGSSALVVMHFYGNPPDCRNVRREALQKRRWTGDLSETSAPSCVVKIWWNVTQAQHVFKSYRGGWLGPWPFIASGKVLSNSELEKKQVTVLQSRNGRGGGLGGEGKKTSIVLCSFTKMHRPSWEKSFQRQRSGMPNGTMSHIQGKPTIAVWGGVEPLETRRGKPVQVCSMEKVRKMET